MILSKVATTCFRVSALQAKSVSRLSNLQPLLRGSRRVQTTLAAETIAQTTCHKPKLVGGWLLTCSAMAFGAVILGGVTRLTKSGLSMVDWNPFAEFPPRSEEQWLAEFEKYQQFPEFKIKNRDMTLSEFKNIWYMEYIHRMWGRTIGAVYYIPATAFWALGYFTPAMKKRVVLFGGLLAFQGFMGWYMVKSGLEEKQGRDTTPRVSHFRLAAHLGTAFIFYSLLFRSALDHLTPAKPVTATPSLMKFIRFSHMGKALVFITAMSGALVAGIEAGLVYNSFPKMADRWIPSDLFAYEPFWSNFVENPTTVQFDHRLLGETVFCFVSGLWMYSRRVNLPPRARMVTNLMLAAAWTQVGLGITTLLNFVPTPLAAAHQAGALTLLTTLLWLTHELKVVRRIPK